MKIFRTVKEMQAFSREQKKAGKVIGLVPTMGAFMKAFDADADGESRL